MKIFIFISIFLMACFLTPKFVISEDINPIYPVYHKDNIMWLVGHYSALYGVSESSMNKIIKCESGFNRFAVGDGGKSFGLVQIHLPAHPYVSKQEAFNPDFAIKFLASHMKNGNVKIWSCARIMGVI